MAQDMLETTLAELAQLDDDFDGRREICYRASSSMLHRPALGGQLIARICAAPENAPELEPLAELLGSVLDAARMAQENRKKRGKAFLMAVTDAVELAAGQGRLTSFHRLVLARAWTQNGLKAPEALELTTDDIDAANSAIALEDRIEADAILDNLFRNLIERSDGDALVLHAALTETFPAMPVEMRTQVIAWSVERPEPVHTRLACFWLLDPAAEIRLAAAKALADRASTGGLSSDVTGKMVMLRSWMPDDDARAAVDQALKAAMRSGTASGTPFKPWTIHSVMATLPDGGGAQSIMIALQSGGSRKIAMLLLKQEHGIKDAYLLPCNSATEQKALIQRITQETGAVKVSITWLERSLHIALADGASAGLPPAPGLIEVAELCGFEKLRPEAVTTDGLISALPEAERIRRMSAQARGKLINASEEWWDHHKIIQSWFEESDHAHDMLEGQLSQRALDAALWRWLETRRDFWARLVARAADVLSASDHPDAASFTATAIALLEGRNLKKIRIMADVHDQTIKAWVFDDPNVTHSATRDEGVEQANAQKPLPEQRGELTRLVKNSALTVDWIDGFLMSITIAPKLIAPNKWLPEISGSVIANLGLEGMQRFAYLIMLHANACVAQAGMPAEFTRSMGMRSKMAMRDWATGFSYAYGQFSSSWPTKKTTTDDRAMINQVSDAMATGISAPELKLLSQWIAARHAQNTGV
ncbi:UPF0149 family protein [Paracoccaceae bacterium Fryx2]|nr:UPF0149 family protein [Paracoccaceae bacterium Fryx2]